MDVWIDGIIILHPSCDSRHVGHSQWDADRGICGVVLCSKNRSPEIILHVPNLKALSLGQTQTGNIHVDGVVGFPVEDHKIRPATLVFVGAQSDEIGCGQVGGAGTVQVESVSVGPGGKTN